MKKWVIIAAGGIGTRMQSSIPKQFIVIGKKPVIIHTIEKFVESHINIDKYIIPCHAEFVTYMNSIIVQYLPNLPIDIVAGGKFRHESIQNALKCLDTLNGKVAIHDAARPCVTPHLINTAFNEAAIYGNCIPYIPLTDSIRQKINGEWRSVNRDEYISIQTPQIFDLEALKSAYTQSNHNMFTDDASAMEKSGFSLHFTFGEYTNIKITTSLDLLIASSQLLNSKFESL